ncbi:hypothetical protein [Marinobacter sp. P4B1]|uniref:hypothetical protein n=1 Tax=Marinobacter sp. P4B1 TaxID=1119533 RepID=UPI00071D2BEF|nr:hypothetical protein [Marinobacter sp. P4B1]KRW83757.1 hypothetical protein AQ621_17050 [Marinobacter sp. P4B1]
MIVSPSYRAKAEQLGQLSMLDDLDRLLDELLNVDVNRPPSWRDEEVTLLKQKLLSFSLEQLNDSRLNAQARDEILYWVFDEMVEKGPAKPFSFQDCCHASDLDPEEMQSRMEHQVRRLEADLLDKNLQALQKRKTNTVKRVLGWVNAESNDFFSFQRCCRAAKANPDSVRDQLIRQFQ